MLRKVGIAQKKRVFDFDFWIIGGIFMKKFVAGVVALTIAFGGLALPAESGVFFDGAAVSASAEEMSEANVDVQAADDVKIAGDSFVYGDFHYQILDDGTVEITYYLGADKEVVIPSTINGKKVTSIGHGAFMECINIEKITIPDSVTTIDYNAFSDCPNLVSITIPCNVTSIGAYSFNGCEKLTSITVDSKNKYYLSEDGVLFNKTKTELVAYPAGNLRKEYTIPDGVKSLNKRAFLGAVNLTNLKIPDSVKTIGEGEFYGCKNLENINIPNGVKKIDSFTFYLCESLTNITIPDSVTSIGSTSFSGCKNLANITIPNGVTSIEGFAFEGCTNLTNITIPDSVNSIGAGAFASCSSLKSVKVPEGVTVIDAYTFNGCAVLTDISFPSTLKSIGYESFTDCKKLKSITFLNGPTFINSSAFQGCTSLANLVLPDSMEEIGSNAFYNCSSLSYVVIPKNIKKIDSLAFSSCKKLKDVYYKGSKSDWKKIKNEGSQSIDTNAGIKDATIHYNYTPEKVIVDKVKTTNFTCTDKAIKINWEKINGAAGYRVYAYNAKTKKWSTAATVSASTLSFKQTGLKSGTTYKYKVKAYAKQDGKTYWGEASDTMTTTTKPAQPAIKSTSASTSAVRLNWNAVSGANGYRVVRYDANAKKWVSVGTIKTTSFKESKLKGKTSYKYKVKAYRKVGGATYWSDYSAVKSVKTK